MKKRIVAFLLVVCAVSLVVSPASAGTSSTIVDEVVTVTATCNVQSSFHSIVESGAYPTGSARIYYIYNGEDRNENVPGASYDGRWNASRTLVGTKMAYKATTTYKGHVVTALQQEPVVWDGNKWVKNH
jgi:hypothetical protein